MTEIITSVNVKSLHMYHLKCYQEMLILQEIGDGMEHHVTVWCMLLCVQVEKPPQRNIVVHTTRHRGLVNKYLTVNK